MALEASNVLSLASRCNLSQSASNVLSLEGSNVLSLTTCCNLFQTACNSMALEASNTLYITSQCNYVHRVRHDVDSIVNCNIMTTACNSIHYLALDSFGINTPSISITCSNGGTYAEGNLSYTASGSNRLHGRYYASISSCNTVACVSADALLLSACNVLTSDATAIESMCVTCSNSAADVIALTSSNLVDVVAGSNVNITSGEGIYLNSLNYVAVQSAATVQIVSDGRIWTSASNALDVLAENIWATSWTDTTFQQGNNACWSAASNIVVQTGVVPGGPSSSTNSTNSPNSPNSAATSPLYPTLSTAHADWSNVTLAMTQDTFKMHADADIIADAGHSFKVSIKGSQVMEATYELGQRPKLRLDCDLEVQGVIDSITVTNTNLRIEDRFLTLAHALDDGPELSDAEIGRAGMFIRSQDTDIETRTEKSITWNHSTDGVAKLAKEDGLARESFWEVRGGSLRLSSVLDDGKRVSWGFRIGQKGDLQVYQVISSKADAAGDEPPTVARVVHRFGVGL